MRHLSYDELCRVSGWRIVTGHEFNCALFHGIQSAEHEAAALRIITVQESVDSFLFSFMRCKVLHLEPEQNFQRWTSRAVAGARTTLRLLGEPRASTPRK